MSRQDRIIAPGRKGGGEEGRRGGGEEGRRGGDRWMEGWRREKEGYSHIIRPTWIASSLLVHVHVA